MTAEALVFGPVPSRRLGQSLGINHVPVKSCTYDCIYCQVGKTTRLLAKRRVFYPPDQVIGAVRQRIRQCVEQGIRIDYLTFVPDGEPTLDLNLERLIDGVKPFGYPVAVITNASLLWDHAVRQGLNKADWVSIKCDAADPDTWKRLNRPHHDLTYEKIQQGMDTFARSFGNTRTTETMLIRNVNDSTEQLHALASRVATLEPDTAFLGIASRPPGEKWAGIPDEETLLKAYQIFQKSVPNVTLLTGYSPEPFQSTQDVRRDLLNATCVHPVRHAEVLQMLQQANADVHILEELLSEGKLKKVLHQSHVFYIRAFHAENAS